MITILLMNVLMFNSLIMVLVYFALCMIDSYYLHTPGKAFMNTINKKRPIVTKIFQLYFRIVILCMAAIALIVGVFNWGSGYSFPVTKAVCTIVFCICYYCILFLHAGTVRGENSEFCSGNCKECDIKCTTNWKYWGVKKK